MPSPNNGKRTSSLSLGRQSVAAIRRGDVKISDPIPLPMDKADEAFALGQEVVNNNSSRSATPATDGTWPRRTTPPENTPLHGSEGGGRDRSRLALNRESDGPSMLLSAMSSKTSLKQRKSGGFRATVRSLFGSKRNRSALSSDRSYYISVSAGLLLSFPSPCRTRWHCRPIIGGTRSHVQHEQTQLPSTRNATTMFAIYRARLQCETASVVVVSRLILCAAGPWQFDLHM